MPTTRRDSRAGGGERRAGVATARLVAGAGWSARRARQVYSRRFVIPRADTPTATPDRTARVWLERDVAVPMRDGVVLRAHVFHPVGLAGALPAILIRQPYGRDDHPLMHARGRYWARKGYVCVVQDVRGKYGSGGRWEPIVHEADDGWDTLDWMASRPWCNGDIGMVGESYHGITQWAVASLGHPSLRCIAPGNCAPDFYRLVYSHGAFALMTMGEWAYEMNASRLRNPLRFDPWHLPLRTTDEAAGARSPVYQDFIAHPLRDAYWERRDLSRRGPVVPAFHWGGWHDVTLDGCLAGWQAATRRPETGSPPPQYLTIAPTDHALTPVSTGRVGRIEVGFDHWSFDRVQRFVDRWLRHDGHSTAGDSPVNVFVVGSNRWRSADRWPLPGTQPMTMYLHGRAGAAKGAGVLSTEPPGLEPADTYVYDPDDPPAYWLGRSLWEMAGELYDRRRFEGRHDVLVYSTDLLTAGLEVVGPLSAVLYASTSAPDTDFTAALVDVFPDGYAQLVQEGIVRLSSLEEGRSVAARVRGAAQRLTVDMCATAHFFAPGHRLRLEVSSANFGRFDRNLNTGHPFGSGTERAPAGQTIFHDRRRPSHVTLPVIAAEG